MSSQISGAGVGTTSPIQFKYPFAAVVGHRAAKHALLLLAVDPKLRGVLIASDGGSVTSRLARAFGPLLPNDDRPNDDRARLPGPDAVEIPLGVTEDRLLGGLDLERTLATGKRESYTGLLAQADSRVLFLGDVNLLDRHLVAHVAHALEHRNVRVEREGLSATHPSSFILVGTFDPAEGEPSSLLRDRVGLIVESTGEGSADEKVQSIDREFRFDADPRRFAEDFALESGEIRSVIKKARALLPRVRASREELRQISLIAIKLGVQGNRADVFAARAARANAALAGRDSVSEDDLVAAIQLVLVPRATTLPAPEESAREHVTSRPKELGENASSEPRDPGHDSVADSVEDLIIQAIDTRVPKDLLRASQIGARASGAGKHFNGARSKRGRYVGSAIEPTGDSRVALDATLRAAAPFQKLRRLNSQSSDASSPDVERLRTYSDGNRVRINRSDLRFKRFMQRSGILFIFAVDASGSMALNRMAQAKGALIRLLGNAYLHRDKVALISFRGEAAEVLLAPTRSVELAKRLVDALPAGGGTPIASGVVKAIELARLARLRGMPRAMLVMFTDGRANVRLPARQTKRSGPSISEELKQLGRLLQSEGIDSVLVDTKSKFVSGTEARVLAEMFSARYLYLGRSDFSGAYKAITFVTRDR